MGPAVLYILRYRLVLFSLAQPGLVACFAENVSCNPVLFSLVQPDKHWDYEISVCCNPVLFSLVQPGMYAA